MAPKLMNRFRVRVKTEPEDQGDNAGGSGAGGASGPMAHVSEMGDDVPISAFQQQRFELEQQQADAGPSRDATTAAAAAAATAGARQGAAGVHGSTTAQAARRAQQSAAATAHAAQVTGTTSAGGAASASVNVDELRRAGQVATVYPEGMIPPISSVDLDRFAVGQADAASVKVKADDGVKAEGADSGDDVKEAENANADTAAVAVDAGVGFLHEADREAQRAHTANGIFFTADGEPKKFEETAEIAWMQLPRMPAAPRLGAALPAQPQRGLLESLPSGRVGRLRVHKSGKVSLVLDDAQAGAAPPVAFDVSAGRPDGMAQNLMAIEPSGDGAADLRCYDLGAVTQRLVCTPKLPDGFDDDA